MVSRPLRTRAGPVLASLPRPTLPTPTTLAVVSDPHLAPDARGSWKVLHRSPDRFRAALADADRRGVDAVLSPGDLTKDGAPEEFVLVDEVLDDHAAPLVAVPGNHDVPKPRWDPYETPPVERFAERYGTGRLPFVERVGGLDVVGLNSASTPDGSLSDTHEGTVGPVQREWLDRTLPALRTPLVCLHHGVTHPASRTDTEGFDPGGHYRVRDGDALRELLVRHDVPLVVSGHVHWPGVAPVGDGYEVAAPATCSLPPSYLLLHVGPRGTAVELVALTDRAGFEEAYASAREGNDHGRAVAASAVSTGLVDDLLLAAEAGPPTSAYRLSATDTPARSDADGGMP
ncbi:metallophosphoesterase family protein [Salinirubellus sp. GCM10025818]|uniref:metallophosphoesterase family protein n=1 Tax=Salinirubellus TaxID=2162630 RepID=UPI0030D2F99E